MTGNRIAILQMLYELGPVDAHNLTIGQKRVGTSLQRDGFARWRTGPHGTRHSLHGQMLEITDAGRAELLSWQSVPAHD